MERKRILVAGVGNELKRDDGFGIALIRHLSQMGDWPEEIKLMEVGIGGIHLVQELHARYDVLVLADAVEGKKGGNIRLTKLEQISDLNDMEWDEKRAFLADMHYTNPLRALMLAKALDILPPEVYILGCTSRDCDDFAIGLSHEVEAAIPLAAKTLRQWLDI